MKPKINLDHDITSLRITKKTLQRVQRYSKMYAPYGATMNIVVNMLLDKADRQHQPRIRNDKGQFVKKE